MTVYSAMIRPLAFRLDPRRPIISRLWRATVSAGPDTPCGLTMGSPVKLLERANQQLGVQPSSEKYFASQLTQIISRNLAVQSRKRGVSRSSRNAGWDVVDARASARKVIAGRVSRERWSARKTNGAICVRQNRVVPTPVAGAKLSVAKSIPTGTISHQAGSDGDKTNSSPGRSRHKP
jgi:hypothetical protein